MARLISRSIKNTITLHVDTIHVDGSVDKKEIRVGDIVEGLRYVENNEVVSVSGKVISFTMSTMKYSGKYTDITATDDFADRIKIQKINIDASDQYESKIISVNPFEIVEDEGVEDVVRMNCYPSITAEITLSYSDGSTVTTPLAPDEYLEDIVVAYGRNLQPGYIAGPSRIITILTTMSKNTDTKISATGLVLQAGTVIVTISFGKIIYIKSHINYARTVEEITEAITGDGDAVAIPAMEYSENIQLEKTFTIVGKKCGIPANKGNRAVNRILDDETVFSGEIEISDGAGNVLIDGVTFTKNARITIGQAERVIFKNCRFIGITPTDVATMGVTLTEHDDGTPVSFIVENCYFGSPEKVEGKSLYNIFELFGFLEEGSLFANNYFVKDSCSKNQIAIYNIAPDAHIYIENNIFEYSENAVRIGTAYDAHGEIWLDRNSYLETCEEDGGKFAGLVVIQPYTTKTETMKHLSIYIDHTKHTDKHAVGYRYYTEGTDTPLTDQTSPIIYVSNNRVKLPLIINR